MTELVDWGVYSVGATTARSVTSSGSSQAVALPVMADGGAARMVRLVSTNSVWVALGTSSGVTVAASGNGALLVNTNDVLLKARGYSHIAVIQQGVGSILNISPIEV